jgi:hypothetical protein
MASWYLRSPNLYRINLEGFRILCCCRSPPNGLAHKYTYGYTHAHQDRYTYPNTTPYAHPYTHPTNKNALSKPDSYINTHTLAYSDTHPRNSKYYSLANTYSSLISVSSDGPELLPNNCKQLLSFSK